MFTAVLGKIQAPVSMDISTGDVITPEAQVHEFRDLLQPEQTIELLSYPIETVLAEKVETVLSRGVENTRLRDFYDIYMLSSSDYNAKTFKKAFIATSKHRGSYEKTSDYRSIVDAIRNDGVMQQRWKGYQKQMPYAADISFDDALEVVVDLMSL